MKLKDGIFKYNPIFGLCLGLCSTLAVSYTVENALVMGISVLFILILSNTIISIIKKAITDDIKIPACIIIVASLTTIVELLLKHYVPLVYSTLGIYLPLITVNCIILGRALSVAIKESVGKSIKDAISSGIGYIFAILLIAIFRELLGSNSLTIVNNLSDLLGFKLIIKDIIPLGIFPMSIFVKPAGSFIAIGIIFAMINWIRRVGDKK